MYSIKSGSTELYHPLSPINIATEAKITEELNTQGSMDMTLLDPIPVNLRDRLGVYDDDDMIWRGRVINIEFGLNGVKEIHCEGALAFLCDTIVKPFSFRGTPSDLFQRFIAAHNADLPDGDQRKFTIGTITVTDPNEYIYRSSETAMTTWEAIKTRLINTLGGYIYLSGKYLNVINYVADFSHECTQEIRFGENMVDMLKLNNAADIVTVLYAYGKRYEESDTHHETEPDTTPTGWATWNGDRLFKKVELPAAKAVWGAISGTNTWDDITLEENLVTAATDWLVDNFANVVESFEATAADLSLIDVAVEPLKVGANVRVVCPSLGVDMTMLCKQKETDLINISQTRVTIGKITPTLTGMTARGQRVMLEARPNETI